MSYVDHPLIKPETIEARLYQQMILDTATRANTLVVLPTGLGKTPLSIMVATNRLTQIPNSKILMMAPTRPLAVQHFQTFRRVMNIGPDKFQVLTGHIPPSERGRLWQEAKLVFATPQVVERDLLANRLSLKNFSLLIFDECVSGDSDITLRDGSSIRIDDIAASLFPDEKANFVNPRADICLKCYDPLTDREVDGKITGIWRTPAESKRIVRLVIENESELILSEDHPVFTVKNGVKKWEKSGNVKEGEKVIVHLEKRRFNDPPCDTTIVTRKQVRDLCVKHRLNAEYVSEVLEKRGLLPLKLNSPAMPVICCILGHIFGDGWLSKNFSVGFSGEKEDLRKIADNLASIGFRTRCRISERNTVSKITTTSGKRYQVASGSAQMVVMQHSLWCLLRSLGAPVGDKVRREFSIPSWLMNSPRQHIQNFLSALCGSECDNILSRGNSPLFYAPKLSLFKDCNLFPNGMKLANQYKKLFEKLGVKVSRISDKSGNRRKNGGTTRRIDIRISNDNDNLLNFVRNIGYEYCKRKSERALAVFAFLLVKKNRLSEMKRLHKEAKVLHEKGLTPYEIAKKFDFFRKKSAGGERVYTQPYDSKLRRILSEKYDTRVENGFIGFKEWSEKNYLGNGNALMKVTKVNANAKNSGRWLYDIEVTCAANPQTHTFFVNNVLVHNCHRAVGNYPYSFIAERYVHATKKPLILGLTASPGGVEKIEEVKKNLFIRRVETRTDRDSDVVPYIQPVKIEWKRLKLPQPVIEIKTVLKRKFKEHLRVLKECGFLHSIQGVSKRELLQVQRGIRDAMKERGPNPPSNFYTALVAQAAAFRLCHAMELLETQGLASLSRYLSGLSRKASKPGAPKSSKLLMSDSQIRRIVEIVDDLQGRLENPKITEAQKILRKQFKLNPNSCAIVFTHYRDSAKRVVQALNSVKGVRPVRFIGQAKREGEKGLTQREQGKILDNFRVGETNTLVSTSVGEEGLDIPSVDLVLFYEAVPSGIRLIQRRGRTGRRAPGRVIALLAKGTRDEAFYWSAVRKEKQTQEAISKAGGGKIEEGSQKMLDEFSGEKIKIIADHREVPSGIVRELIKLGAGVETRQLEVGDFILSERVGVERKTTQDFLQSMIDKRLIDQAKQLAEAFERPVLILEGKELYAQRDIHPNAIRGALASLAVDYGIPILPAGDERETARLLFAIARREQEGVAREIPVRGIAKGLTLPEQQRFIVEGLPGVSAVLAKRLLEHFGTVERIVQASEDELREVHGIGKEKAKRIHRVLSSKYESEEQG